MAKKVTYRTEPILKEAPRYFVRIKQWRRKPQIVKCKNREEVRALRRRWAPGAVMEVYRVTVDFKEAYCT